MADDAKTDVRPVVTREQAKAAGATFFWTGRPCKQAHLSERYVAQGNCLACNKEHAASDFARRQAKARYAVADPELRRAYNAAYQAVHREENRLRKKAWRQANPERNRANFLAWSAANPDRVRGYEVARRVKNPRTAEFAAYHIKNRNRLNAAALANKRANLDARRATGIAYRKANPEKLRVRALLYAKANPEKVLAYNRNRQARKTKAGGSHTGDDIKALFRLQRGKCAHSWCRTSPAGGYHVDHIKPLALGGSNDKRNLQLLCQPCNSKKWAHDPIDFAQANGLLL